MRKNARIVVSVPKLHVGYQRVLIPKGDCEFDDGPHGTGPYIVYWKEKGQVLSSELTISEFVTYVDVHDQPSPRVRRRTNHGLAGIA